MTGRAIDSHMANFRVWLARRIYPGKFAYIRRGHQGNTSTRMLAHDPGGVRCNYCGAAARDWGLRPCRTDAGTLTAPEGLSVHPGATQL